jgi:hypothetical protein
MTLRFASLPRADFPEFYARVDERDWLRARLAEQQAFRR